MSRVDEKPPRQRAELAARWHDLKRRLGPVLSPEALALSLVLALSMLVSTVLQFGTTVFQDLPGLSMALAALNMLLACAVAILVVVRGRYEREQLTALVVLALVVVLSMGSMGAKLQYQRGLQGNPFYALPHQPVAYPASARTVILHTRDGVRLVGTILGRGTVRGVVIYPSWRTTRHSFSLATMAQWLANDFDVLVIDPRGQGDSGGAKHPGGDGRMDLLAAVAYMRETGHLRVGVLAEQDAAYPAVLAAAAHEGIDSLALAAPSYNWGGSLGQDGRLWDPRGLWGRLYWRVVAGLRITSGAPGPALTEAIRQVAPTPVLFLGHRSGVGTEVDRLHGAAEEPKSLVVLPGEGTPVQWGQFAEYYKAVEEWFELSLRPDESRPLAAPAP